MTARKNGKFCAVPDGYVHYSKITAATHNAYKMGFSDGTICQDEMRKEGFIAGIMLTIACVVFWAIIWWLL